MIDHMGSFRIFADRCEAGRWLAAHLPRERLRGPVLLALPRGGVPVGREIAAVLDAELDVLLVRKLGAPLNPELAFGAVASGGITVYNRDVMRQLGLDERDLDRVRERELAELRRRERVYRGSRPPPAVRDRSVILVDDGVATGATMEAAISAVRQLGPAEIIVAVPTAAADAAWRLRRLADGMVCAATPEPYIAVGAWYRSFPQLSDEEVVALLESASRERRERASGGDAPG